MDRSAMPDIRAGYPRFLRALLNDAAETMHREPLCIYGWHVFQSRDYAHTVNWATGEHDGKISAREVCDALGLPVSRFAKHARKINFARVKIARLVREALNGREMRVYAELPMGAWVDDTLKGKPIDVVPIVEKWCAKSAAFVDTRIPPPPPIPRCRAGHLIKGDNVYVYPSDGRLACRKCRRAAVQRNAARRLAKKREEAA
jgi:hypothetical protein